jgi:predicted lysophospholipase L1 biosynthesis ABC-type transport system permease subunit
LIEFSLVGALSGVLAASGAAAMGWALATYQFKFAWSFSPTVWLVGLLAGALCAIAGGWLGLRNACASRRCRRCCRRARAAAMPWLRLQLLQELGVSVRPLSK